MQFSLPVLLALVALASASSVPSSFDARHEWSKCEWQIWDQGRCGSCWAFSSYEAFSDRSCIWGDAVSGTLMSPEPCLECSRDSGCDGGNPNVAWNWAISNGDATATHAPKLTGGCAPYDLYNAGRTPKCHVGKCDDGSNWPKTYHATSYKSLPSRDVETAQKHLMSSGPLQACFKEYNNFQSFFRKNPNGIYTEASGGVAGGHCVKLIGWGVSGHTKYWLIANSWGTTFAEDGYFKFLMGTNLCNLESEISEGFVKGNGAALEAFDLEFPDYSPKNDSMKGGDWWVQEDIELDLYEKAAFVGLEKVNEKTGKNYVFEKNLAVRTQSAAGINFDLTLKTVDGPVMKLTVHRSFNMVDWELVEFELIF